MAKRKPDGLLVLYDENKGLRQPEIQLFNPSATIERDVNRWIQEQDQLNVHKVEWLPSGGLLGASVLFSRNGDATQSLRIVVPGLEAALRASKNRGPLENLARLLLTFGIVLGLIGIGMFSLFYPTTWYAEPGALIGQEAAIKSTVVVIGVALILMFSAVGVLFRARVA
jgi:hypothetical protein